MRIQSEYHIAWADGMPPSVEKFLFERCNSDDERIFSYDPKLAANALNDEIKRHTEKKYTTYSWRRCFMFRISDECKGDTRKALLYSNHLKESTLHYTKWKTLKDKEKEAKTEKKR